MFHPDDDGLRARAANEDDVLTPEEQRQRAIANYEQNMLDLERAYRQDRLMLTERLNIALQKIDIEEQSVEP